MLRQKAFWENYLMYASVKAEQISENRREIMREERYVSHFKHAQIIVTFFLTLHTYSYMNICGLLKIHCILVFQIC